MTKKIYLAIIPIVAVIIFFIFYFQSNELLPPVSSQPGILHGQVHYIGKICQEQLGSPPCDGPYSDYEIIIYDEDGKSVVKKVLSDDNGYFETELDPGIYTINVPKRQMMKLNIIPEQIVIEPSKSLQFDIVIDSGIR